MKNSIKHFSFAATLFLAGAFALHAQQRSGGGNRGGGFGGFGGFGGSSSSTSSQYNNNGTVGSAQITVDPDTHNIVVTADAVTAAQIKEVLASLDKPKPQVLIKVVFMEVDLNNELDLGIEGGWAPPANNGISQTAGQVFGLSGLNSVATNFNALGGMMPVGSLTPGSSSSILPSGSFYQIAGSDFEATLKAVAAAGKGQVLSRPSILARDGQLAEIVVGQRIYLPSGVTISSGVNGADIPTINGSYQNVGIILDVTPFIGNDHLVQMIVQPQTSAVDSSSPGQVVATAGLLGTPIYAPNIDIRSADTVVVTPDAQPVVIGGLIGSDKAKSETKVPFLGDLPLLGNLFKYTSTTSTKTELLIFLTPHIIQNTSQLMTMSSREMNQAPEITNSVSEQELEQYLEKVPMKVPGKKK